MTTEDACKLFVAGLPDSLTEEVLRQLFEAAGGTVVEVNLPRDRATGRLRGFGFVTLETADQAANARSVLDGSVQAGRSISVRPFQTGTPRREVRPDTGPVSSGEDRTLYLGNLPYDASQQEVAELLERLEVASVARIHMPLGPDGKPRGFGFVTLSSADAVPAALDALSSAELRGRRVQAKVAHPRGSSPHPANAPVFRQPDSSRGGDTPPSSRPHRTDASVAEYEDDGTGPSDGERPSSKARVAADKRSGKPRGTSTTTRRRSDRATEDRRGRGGASAWQRWKDWDED